MLIHAAASSVGLQCVQLAKYFGAGIIIATTRTDRATELLTSVGADHVVVIGKEGFADQVLPWTEVEKTQDLMAKNSGLGKIVLALGDGSA